LLELIFMSAGREVAARHLFGRESELGVTDCRPEHRLSSSDNVPIEKYVPGLARVEQFLSNGSRLYADVGEHLEYAGPECQTLTEMVAADLAGQDLLAKFVAGLNIEHASGNKSPVKLNTRLIDDKNNTWGSHENYGVGREISPYDQSIIEVLASHLVTRSIFTGVGRVTRGNQDPNSPSFGYTITQKTRRVREVANKTTVHESEKPIINQRDEAHGQARRLHIICGDPTMSPWATSVAFGSMSLVIRLLEHDVEGIDDTIVRNPVVAARSISEDLVMDQTISLANGRNDTPIGIQRRFAEMALKLAETVKLPDEEVVIAEEWYRAADDAEKDPMLLSDRVEWVRKLELADHYLSRTDLKIEDRLKRIRGLDMAWGELSERGVALKLRRGGKFQDPLAACDLKDELLFKPPLGRPALRSAAIRALSANIKAITEQFGVPAIHWSNIHAMQTDVVLSDEFGEDLLQRAELYSLLEMARSI
jgi:Pup-ligase protein